jgi:hypothetical protein
MTHAAVPASGPGAAGTSAEQPPPDVAAAAQHRQLGQHLATRRLMNALVAGGLGLLASVGSLGLLILVSFLASDIDGPVRALLRFIALFFCFAFVGALAWGIAALVRGNRSFHVYAGGFIYRHNGKIRVISWPEVTDLRQVIAKRGEASGKIQHYQLTLHDGKHIAIPLAIVDGRDYFMDQLMAVLHHSGIPVR